MIKFCKKCHDEKKIRYWGDKYGYLWTLTDDAKICPDCQSNLVDIDFPALDLKILSKISDSTDFYDAMIKLHDDDIIEYELKMSQFRSQVEAQEAEEERKKAEESKPRCPKCGSTNITAGQRGYSFWTGFLGSNKTVNRCSNCGHTWKP
jgi:hypothetical protein